MDFFRLLVGLPPAASTMANDVDMLHATIITATMLISFFVFGAAIWFTIRDYRQPARALTKSVEGSRRNEALTIAVVLTAFVSWWVIGFRQYVQMSTVPADSEIVYVEAKQWMWKFSYTDGRDSNNVLTVPQGSPVALMMSSRDVIHSFFVPAFRVKADVIPGRTTSVWFNATTPGHYPIYCAEYCGVSHSAMLGEVVVLSQEDYAVWKSAGGQKTDLVELGRSVATTRACVACHTLDGQRHVGPTWEGLYGSERVLADGRHVIADAAYLTRSMMEPNADIVDGYPAVMPVYQGKLTAAEAGALVAFIGSLRTGTPTPSPGSGIALPALDVVSADADAGSSMDGGRPR